MDTVDIRATMVHQEVTITAVVMAMVDLVMGMGTEATGPDMTTEVVITDKLETGVVMEPAATRAIPVAMITVALMEVRERPEEEEEQTQATRLSAAGQRQEVRPAIIHTVDNNLWR